MCAAATEVSCPEQAGRDAERARDQRAEKGQGRRPEGLVWERKG